MSSAPITPKLPAPPLRPSRVPARALSVVLALFLLLPGLCFARPQIIAHRGASYDAPENTLAAYREAERQGADGWELDIHLSADGRMVLMHDKATSRTTGVLHTVANTHSDRLRQLDAGSWKDARYAGEKIPFLEEVIDVLPENVRLFIEIKSSFATMLTLDRLLRKHPKLKQVTLISFDLETCALGKALYPEMPVYWLVGTEKNNAGRPIPFGEELIQIAKQTGLDGLDLNYQGLHAEFVRKATALGLEVHAWTVDEADSARNLAEMGVKSITTNRPAFIRDALKD